MAQTSTGVASDKPETPIEERTVIASRDAPVPNFDDPDERIIFVKAGSVWIMRPDGSDATQLTVRSHGAADESPALSPDGTRVAYSSPADGTSKIYVVSLEELVPTPITDGAGGGDTAPTWSPDGKRIAFTRGDPRERRDLYVVAADGSSPPTLLLEGDDANPVSAGSPCWSPDGVGIVMAADRRHGRGTTLWTVDVETRRLSPITPQVAGGFYVRDEDPSIAPDGQTIYFASNRHATSPDHADDLDIYSIHPDGSGLTRLTEDPGVASDPSISADGKRLFFTSDRLKEQPYEREIFVMHPGGGKQRRLTRDERPQNSAPHAGRSK